MPSRKSGVYTTYAYGQKARGKSQGQQGNAEDQTIGCLHHLGREQKAGAKASGKSQVQGGTAQAQEVESLHDLSPHKFKAANLPALSSAQQPA